ncbi:MAG: glycosyltransferase [Elainella sp.]
MTTRFGIFCPPAIGHLNPICALALELQRRGHSVTLFGVPDALAKVEKLDLATCEIGALDYPRGSIDRAYKTLGELTGRAGLKFTIDFFKRETEMLFREAPEAIRAADIEMLIVDQVTSPIATVADYLDLPFVTVCNAMLIHHEPAVPPYFTHWAYSTTLWARLRNRLGNALVNFLTGDLWREICTQRCRWNLPACQKRDDSYSPLAQMCQLPKAFDFPRERLPAHFHYIVQNQRPEIFKCIAQACSTLEAQLVISLGHPEAQPIDLPGDPIVVPFAPHQRLIERSQVVVTHAGMNTVLTALGCGVPLVAIPITNEQPGIASRLARTKAGKTLQLSKLNEITLRTAISEVLSESSYRDNAQQLQKLIQASGGVKRAADIIEEAAQTRQPVMAKSVSDTERN